MVPLSASGTAATTTAEARAAAGTPSLSWRKSMRMRSSLRDLDNKLLKAFNKAFHERYKKHSNWVIYDESLSTEVALSNE
ncbi:hypothetical protein GBA52_009933 [Prunus armeniaca]|nr:hypothetical protein GBA52_009933 [Prunus armeniaca]